MISSHWFLPCMHDIMWHDIKRFMSLIYIYIYVCVMYNAHTHIYIYIYAYMYLDSIDKYFIDTHMRIMFIFGYLQIK